MKLMFMLIYIISIQGINLNTLKIDLKLKIKNELSKKIKDFKIKDYRLPSLKGIKSIKQIKSVEFLGNDLTGSTAITIKTGKRKFFGSIVIARKVKNLYALRNIKRGEKFSKDDFEEVITYQTAKSQTEFISEYSQIEGKVAKINIKPYKKLYSHQFEYPYIIKKGEEVTIRAQKGKLLISMTGVAKQNGKLGNYITVKSDFNNKILRAKVTAPKTVSVFTGE